MFRLGKGKRGSLGVEPVLMGFLPGTFISLCKVSHPCPSHIVIPDVACAFANFLFCCRFRFRLGLRLPFHPHTQNSTDTKSSLFCAIAHTGRIAFIVEFYPSSLFIYFQPHQLQVSVQLTDRSTASRITPFHRFFVSPEGMVHCGWGHTHKDEGNHKT